MPPAKVESRGAEGTIDGILAALADPTRRGVVEVLRQGPRRAGELAEHFHMTPPAMSRHLRLLMRRGLIEDERVEQDARLRLFRLRREPFTELQGWLQKVETFWTDQLDAFKTHAETTKRRKRS